MKRITISNINKIIRKHGYELIKGNEYFYFAPLAEKYPILQDSMVCVYHLSSLNYEQWEEELLLKIKDTCANNPGLDKK